jgi:hypothetical protein
MGLRLVKRIRQKEERTDMKAGREFVDAHADPIHSAALGLVRRA